ncbi:protein translocase subunit SecD [Actinoallomurus bryophytorum]|uniref:Protein translocase subunit SecD n=1 Tax=Actinoallomurus bryophytorum TaxID=1490222 RepID=A0A543CVQ2_9ACTN|nr:protein translocase subunit SecD [Actinoallomurus bryophytorum]TQM01182.1 preprotein translocase subunit SecD [Actinoallomurus bryophytorum]
MLLTLLVIAVALVGLMFWQGTKTPKLALDLAGGTTVTLTAEPAKAGAKIGDSEMSQAISIMRERVNGLGVSEAEVTKQGSNVIIVQVPGQGQERVVKTIGTTAKLEFRQVMVAEPVGVPQQPTPPPASPTPTPSGKASKSPKPSGSATPSGKASPTPKGRALAQALTAETPKPTTKPSGKAATPAPSATQSLTPEQQQQLEQQLQAQQQQQQQQQAGAEDFSGVDPAVKAQFDKLTCTGNDVGQGLTLNATKQAAICARPDPKTHKSDYKFILAPTQISGEQVTKAQALPPDPQNGRVQWTVSLDLNGTATKTFADFTSKAAALGENNTRNHFAIVLDGTVYSWPSVKEAITSGNAQIEGQFGQQEATDLANVLKYGALPLKFNQSSIESVSATLGKDQLTAGLTAGAIGLGLVVLYCLFYYRGLGFVAISSLVIAGCLTYESIVLLGKAIDFRMSLAGIAGAIVAIGITADSFVVFFERLRDEIREGRSLRTAVERGWHRARRTIIVADAVSFIAALLLYWFAIGGVKGFAFTLGLTTLIDVIVVFFFTKPLVTILARTRFFGGGHRFSGLDPSTLGTTKRRTNARPTSTKEA